MKKALKKEILIVSGIAIVVIAIVFGKSMGVDVFTGQHLKGAALASCSSSNNNCPDRHASCGTGNSGTGNSCMTYIDPGFWPFTSPSARCGCFPTPAPLGACCGTNSCWSVFTQAGCAAPRTWHQGKSCGDATLPATCTVAVPPPPPPPTMGACCGGNMCNGPGPQSSCSGTRTWHSGKNCGDATLPATCRPSACPGSITCTTNLYCTSNYPGCTGCNLGTNTCM